MPYQILNTIGLLFSIGGVALLFRFGPPMPTLEEGVPLGVEGKAVDEHNARVRKLRQKHEKWSRIALILIIFGFALQLCATWLF